MIYLLRTCTHKNGVLEKATVKVVIVLQFCSGFYELLLLLWTRVIGIGENRSNFDEVNVAPAPSLPAPPLHLPPAVLGENMCEVSKRPALNYMRRCNHKVPTVYIHLRSVNDKIQKVQKKMTKHNARII